MIFKILNIFIYDRQSQKQNQILNPRLSAIKMFDDNELHVYTYVPKIDNL